MASLTSSPLLRRNNTIGWKSVQPFGIAKRAHKFAPKGEQRAVPNIAHNHTRETKNVLIVETG